MRLDETRIRVEDTAPGLGIAAALALAALGLCRGLGSLIAGFAKDQEETARQTMTDEEIRHRLADIERRLAELEAAADAGLADAERRLSKLDGEANTVAKIIGAAIGVALSATVIYFAYKWFGVETLIYVGGLLFYLGHLGAWVLGIAAVIGAFWLIVLVVWAITVIVDVAIDRLDPKHPKYLFGRKAKNE